MRASRGEKERTMMTTDKDTQIIKINGIEYYKLPYAAKLVDMSGPGLNQLLQRLGREIKKRPGSNRIYVKKEDIDFLLEN